MASQLSSKTITAVYGITQNYIAAFLRLSALAKINTSGQKLAKRREPCLLAACAATRRVAFAPGGAAAAGVKGAARPVVSEPSPAREGRRRSAAILLVDDLRNDVRLLLAQRTRGLQPDLLQAHGTITQLTGGARARVPEGGAAIACDGAARPGALRTHNVTERAKVELVVRPHLSSPTHVLANLWVAKQAGHLDDRLCTREPSPHPSV